ncbi:MAG: type II toxin-antitoxin system VapC family toxin [Acidobacteriota bacterium]
MILLLDTHAFLWLMSEPERLSRNALDACSNREHRLLLSLASVWEIQIKSQLGRLALRTPIRDMVEQQVADGTIELLPIRLEHVVGLDALPPVHRDPFDRILVSQARIEEARLMTKDARLMDYPIRCLW